MPLTAPDIEPALASWPELHGATALLINHSENQTFLVTTVAGEQFALRVHRIGYQSPASISSELAWMEAIRRDTALSIPEPIAGLDGELLQQIATGQGDRLAVLFQYLPGSEPRPEADLRDLFVTLGGYAATLHQHASTWPRTAGFQRQVWQAETILDADGLWGDWRVAPGVDAGNRAMLDRLATELVIRLADYGTAPDRFGLIHADMRLGNILVHGAETHLIDFDDCGFCWFAYDFAAAISFHEASPAIPGLKAAWLSGYQARRPLAAEDIAIMDSMVMLRRMALLAWMGSHGETRLARKHMPGYGDDTARMAERYLAGGLWS